MKWLLIAILAFPFTQTNAQNLSKQSDWTKSAAATIPLNSGKPYYDTVVTLNDDFNRDKLEDNAKNYFKNIFSSDFVKASGKHTMTGCGHYLINIGNNDDAESIYKVVYLLDITSKEGKYSVEMHGFTIEHLGSELDLSKKLASAKETDGQARRLLNIFQKKNQEELKKVYSAMNQNAANSTASR